MDGRRKHRLLRPLLCSLGLSACGGGPDSSGSASETGDSAGVELAGPGFVIDGAAAGDSMVAIPIADVDGDGYEDLLVNVERPLHPVAFLVFGKDDEAPVDLAAVEAGESNAGVMIDWGVDVDDEYSLTSREAVGVGDINGDGLGDIGAVLFERYGARSQADVVYGAPALPSPVDLPVVVAGMGGFRVDTNLGGDSARRIHGVGDIDGDGLGDLALEQIGGFSDHLALLFGGSEPLPGNLAEIDAGIGGVFLGNPYSMRVLGPADVDGDGFADLVYAEYGGPFQDSSFVHIRTGEAGFSVDSPARMVLVKEEFYDLGQLVAAATGDMDGDGLSDLIIAADDEGADLQVFVVFGAGLDGDLDLPEEFGDHGYVISLGGLQIAHGLWDSPPLPALEAVRDLNGDGRDELLVRTTSGTYLIHGKADLQAQVLSADGVLFETPPLVGGAEVGDLTGIGSIRGLEPTDRVYAEQSASPAGREGAGRAYVLFGASE